MNILTLDGTQRNCQYAISMPKNALNLTGQHEGPIETLPGFLKQTLENHNITLNELSHIACMLGPGNYTGLRATQVIVKSFAQVNPQLKVFAANRLEVMLYSLVKSPHESKAILATQSVRQNEYYGGVGFFDGKKMRYSLPLQTFKAEALKSYWQKNPGLVIGDWECEQEQYQLSNSNWVEILNKWIQNGLEAVSANTIEPFYIRPATQAKPRHAPGHAEAK